MSMNIDHRLIELVEIESVESIHHMNAVDITIEDDESFLLSDGIISHNSASLVKGAANRDVMGFLALRGVPLNVNGQTMDRILGKQKKDGSDRPEGSSFYQIMVAMGLKIGEKVKHPSQLRYSKLSCMTDADHDGAGHITGLLISNLYKFWPELFEMGVVHRFITPIVKVWVNGKNKPPLQFFEEHEYKAWKAANPDFKGSMKYYKGLGTSEEPDFKEYFANINDHLIQLRIDEPEDSEVINLVFNKGAGLADRRKEWLALTEGDVDIDLDMDSDGE